MSWEGHYSGASCMGVNEAPSPPSAHRHTTQLGIPGKARAPLQHLISSSGERKWHLPLGVILCLKLANIAKALSARGWHAAGAILSISSVGQRHRLPMRVVEGADGLQAGFLGQLYTEATSLQAKKLSLGSPRKVNSISSGLFSMLISSSLPTDRSFIHFIGNQAPTLCLC